MDLIYYEPTHLLTMKVAAELTNYLGCELDCLGSKVIAGGAIRSILTNSPINDLDVYSKFDPQNKKKKTSIPSNFVKVYSDKYFSVYLDWKKKKTIQIINASLSVVEQFDFTICQAYYDINTGDLVCYPEFLKHIKTKQIVNNPKFNNVSTKTIERVKKFQKLGFTISPEELSKISESIITQTKFKINNHSEISYSVSIPSVVDPFEE